MNFVRSVVAAIVLMAVVGVVLFTRALDLTYRTDFELEDGTDIREFVIGRWDWARHDPVCSDSTHAITFSEGGRVMRITQQQAWVDSTGRDRTTAVYDLHGTSSSRIRGQIRGEERLTEDGTPVVWDLVLTGPDEYRWHRTDWDRWGFTGRIVRCPGTVTPAPRKPSSVGEARAARSQQRFMYGA